MTRKTTILTAILLLGLLARVYGMVKFPFEQDELYTVDEATNLFHTRLQPGIQARPVFFLMEHPLVVELPHNPVVLRTLPLLFGIAGLLVIWVLACRVLDEEGALVATVLACLSPWHLYASGFGRYYSLLFLLATLVYWLLPRAVDLDRPKAYIAALIPLLIGAWTHPSFVFPVAGAALAIHMVGRDGSIRWRWPSKTAWLCLWGPLIVCSVVILLIVKVLHHTATVANGGDRGLMATIRLIPAMVDWMTPTVFITGAIGAIILTASLVPARRRFGLMALCGVAGMLVALFALSFVTAIYADYGISALPLVFIGAAGVVQWVGDAVALRARTTRSAVMTVVTIIMVVGTLPSVGSYLSDGTRFDYRPAFARIQKESPTTATLAWPLILQRHYAPSLRSYELVPSKPRLDSLLDRERDLWAVISVKQYGIVGDDAGDLSTWLGSHCHAVDHYQRPRLDYRLYRVELWRCAANTPTSE